MNIILILLVSTLGCYGVFVFIAESFRLFSVPKSLNQRKRYQLGRRIAFTIFLASLTFLFSGASSIAIRIFLFAAVAAPFLAVIVYWHRSTDVFGKRRMDTGT